MGLTPSCLGRLLDLSVSTCPHASLPPRRLRLRAHIGLQSQGFIPIRRARACREGMVYNKVTLGAMPILRLDCSDYLLLLASISCWISLARFRPAAISLAESLAVMLAKIVRATSLVSAASVK